MHKYAVIIYWRNADGAFVAEVPELPDAPLTATRRERRWPK